MAKVYLGLETVLQAAGNAGLSGSWFNMKNLFILVPITYIGLFTWKTIDGTIFSETNKKFASWFGAYAILNLCTIVAYIFVIRPLELIVGEQFAELDDVEDKPEDDEKLIEQKLKR